MFASVLVANRGEIACRVMRTLRALGIRSVAVYSDADADALHVRMADVAVRIGPAAALDSYLSVDAIMRAAREQGVDAIHPGYGFLSESPALARACAEAGIVFIGPPVEAIELMGDKMRAKAHVAASGVPVIAGVGEPGMSDDELVRAAEPLGFPLIVKPSAGGGGKGMHVVESAGELPDALAGARRTAVAAFGDGELLLERFLPSPRHIEVQVLADAHGGVVHLGERECSLQRRHQKVIEEAPSPLVDAALRERMGAAACEVARSAGYTGVGTVEFLVSGQRPDEFFFMEMNTRLQVEHPVTELVVSVAGRRIDLVEQQLRVAAGETLGFEQHDVALDGHAVEARLYAEDPRSGFLPSTGTILALREPSGDGIRLDSALHEGMRVTADYDPMLAKVSAWAPDRAAALLRLDTALSDTLVLGVHSNIEFLRALLGDPAVRAGELDTGLIERMLASGREFGAVDDELLAAAAREFFGVPFDRLRDRMFPEPRTFPEPVEGPPTSPEPVEGPPAATDPWHRRDGWRLGESTPPELVIEVNGVRNRVRPGGVARAHVDVAREGDTVWLGRAGASAEFRLLSRECLLAESLRAIERAEGAANPELTSPMPGTVVAVSVVTGDLVEVGTPVAVVEAMKMEHPITASVAGTITVSVSVGDAVAGGRILATIEPRADAIPQGDHE